MTGNVKLPHYAAAGVPGVWIEDLQHDVLLVYRELLGKSYKTIVTLKRKDSVAVLAFPDVVFKVADII